MKYTSLFRKMLVTVIILITANAAFSQFNIGTIPKGDSIVIRHDVTINANPPVGTNRIANQWTIKGGNFVNFVTDDPDTGAPLDSTFTVLVLCNTSTLPTIKVLHNPLCPGSPDTLVIIGGSLGDGTHWQWYTGSCGGTALATQNALGDTLFVSPGAATTYYVRGEGGCVTGAPCASVTVDILTVSAPTVTQPDCITPTGTIVVNANVGTSNLEYRLNGGTWQTSNSFSALASGNYNIEVRNEGVEGCVVAYSGNPVTINIQPLTPTVDPVGNQVVCHNTSTAVVTFTGSPAGTVFNWTNNDPSIGLAASGTGNIAAFNAINTGNAPVVATITVTPSYTNAGGTCNGTPTTFTITVNPTPNAVATPASQTICSGPITTIVLTGNVSGTDYNWTRDNNVSVSGIAANGSGDISGTLTNNTTAAVTVTFTITPAYTNAGVTCTGAPITATVTVNPRPDVVATPAAQTICSGSAITTIALTSNIAGGSCGDLFFSEYLEGVSNNKAIEVYNPTNATVNLADYAIYRYNNGSSSPSDMLFMQGTLAPGAVFVAGNPSAVAGILAVSDTLHTITFFNGDDAMALVHIPTNTILDIVGIIGNDPGTNWPVGTGATSEFTLVRNAAVFQGNTNWAMASTEYDVYPQNTTSFLGSHTNTPCNAGATLNWTRDNTGTVTGIAASGSGDINGSLTNTTNAPVTVTFTITPTANGCAGTAVSATVVVNPIPNAVATPASQTICSGPVNTIVLTGNVSGTDYNWTRDNLTVTGIAASGAGDIAGSLVNTSNAAITVTFTITPSYSNAGVTCTGAPITATVLVAPMPVLQQTYNGVQVTANNDGTDDVGTFTVCSSASANVFLTEITDITNITPVANVKVDQVIIRTGINFPAAADGVYPITTIGPLPLNRIATLTSPFVGGTIEIRRRAFYDTDNDNVIDANECVGDWVVYNITVNPVPDATATPSSQTICSGAITPIVLTGNVSGTVYNWTRDNGDVASGTVQGIAASGSGDISGTLTNTTTSPVTVTFTITPSYTNAGVTCTGTPITATVLVNPTNTITLSSAAGTDNQTVLINTPITDITYATTFATGATFSGLPAGVTGNGPPMW